MQIRKIDAKVLIAKAEPFSCEVLSKLLENEGFDVVGRASELDDFVFKIKVKKPKCVIVEAAILLEALARMEKPTTDESQGPKIIVYVDKPNAIHLNQLLTANLSGYLHTSDCLSELYTCWHEIQTQPRYFSSGFKHLIKGMGLTEIDSLTKEKIEMLTKRERQILNLMTDGDSGYEISDKLCISYRTLAVHKQNITQKLSLDSNRNLLRFGLQVKKYLA